MHLLVTALLLFAFLILIMIYQANELQKVDVLYLTFFRTLFFLLPVLVGAAAIAEERRQKLSAWHLTLPPTRIRQWGMKLLVCMVLAWISTEDHLPKETGSQHMEGVVTLAREAVGNVLLYLIN